MKFLLMLCLALATARAQDDFRAYAGMEDLADGVRMEKLTVVTGGLQFKFTPPKGWSCHADGASRQLLLQSPSGRSEMKVLFLTNLPGTLPEEKVLQERALLALPGGAILQSSVCPTGYVPGVFFDLLLRPFPEVVLKVRHAFVAVPHGQLEFIMAANGDEFEKSKFVIMRLLQSIKVAPANPDGTLVSVEPRNTNDVIAEQLYQRKSIAGLEHDHRNQINRPISIVAMPPRVQAGTQAGVGQLAQAPESEKDSSPGQFLPSLAVATLVATFASLRYYRNRQQSQVVFHDEFETLWEPEPEIAPRKMADETFFCKATGVYGRGLHTKDGFLVLKSSIGRKEKAASKPGAENESLQAKLLSVGVMREQEELLIFDKDHLFLTPTMAAMVLMGKTVNGWLEWKTEDGITLDTVERLEPRQQILEPAPSAETPPSTEASPAPGPATSPEPSLSPEPAQGLPVRL